jgi:hypothetical protein
VLGGGSAIERLQASPRARRGGDRGDREDQGGVIAEVPTARGGTQRHGVALAARRCCASARTWAPERSAAAAAVSRLKRVGAVGLQEQDIARIQVTRRFIAADLVRAGASRHVHVPARVLRCSTGHVSAERAWLDGVAEIHFHQHVDFDPRRVVVGSQRREDCPLLRARYGGDCTEREGDEIRILRGARLSRGTYRPCRGRRGCSRRPESLSSPGRPKHGAGQRLLAACLSAQKCTRISAIQPRVAAGMNMGTRAPVAS